jgi:hypothetical protein
MGTYGRQQCAEVWARPIARCRLANGNLKEWLKPPAIAAGIRTATAAIAACKIAGAPGEANVCCLTFAVTSKQRVPVIYCVA